MKKFSFLAAAFAVFFSFTSCNLLSSDKISETGRAEFSLSPELARAVIDSLQADEGEANPHMTQNLSIEVKLIGEYSAEKSLQIDVTDLNIEQKNEDLKSKIEDKLTSQTIVIDSIPAGKRVSADVKVYLVSSHGDIQMKKDILVKGKSDPVTISAGDNLISVALSIVYRSYPVTFNLSFEKAGGDFTTCRSVDLYAVKADSDTVLKFFSTFAEGQGSAIDFYNILNGHLNPDCFTEAYWYKDSENKDIDQTAVTEDAMTLSGKIYLPFDEKIIVVALANFTGATDEGLYYICHVPGSSMDEVMSHAFVPDAGGNTVELKSNKLAVSTQYALYKFNSKNQTYHSYYDYYLSSAVSYVPAAETYTRKIDSFCFDADGYFYVADKNDSTETLIVKTNKFENEITITTGGSSGISAALTPNVAIDTAQNILYMTLMNYSSFNSVSIIYLPTAISAGNSDNYKQYTFTSSTTATSSNNPSPSHLPRHCVVHDGKFYFFCYKYKSGYLYETAKDGLLFIASRNPDSSVTNLVQEKYVDLGLSTMDLSSNAEVKDMIYQDGAIYLLVRDSSSGNTSVTSRGALIKYDIKKETVESYGFAPAKDLTNFTAACTSSGSFVYKSQDLTDYFTTSFEETFTVNAPFGNLNSYFVGPEKFIAIKPKKLVISDTGLAFYSNSDIPYKKKVNRVVEIDLASLSMENATKTDVSLEFNTSYPAISVSGISVNYNESGMGVLYKTSAGSFTTVQNGTSLKPAFIEE